MSPDFSTVLFTHEWFTVFAVGAQTTDEQLLLDELDREDGLGVVAVDNHSGDIVAVGWRGEAVKVFRDAVRVTSWRAREGGDI